MKDTATLLTFLTLNRSSLKRLNVQQRFSLFLSLLEDTPYQSGHEGVRGFDCSGSLCLSLLLSTGCAVRMTADSLLNTVFTLPYKADGVNAVFWKKTDSTPAVHTAGLISPSTVLNASEPDSKIMSLSNVMTYFDGLGMKCLVKSLDLKKLSVIASGKNAVIDGDREFLILKDFFKGGYYE